MAFASQSAILPLFVQQYTASPVALGLITALFMMGMNVTQVFGAANMARITHFWPTFKILLLLPRLSLFAMALTPWLPGNAALIGFFVSYAAFGFTLGFQVPLWFEYVSHIVPTGRRGRFFGYRFALSGIASILATGAAAWLLSSLPHPWGFAACFLASATSIYVAYLCMVSVRYDWTKADGSIAAAPPFWPTALDLLKNHKAFRTYVATRILLSGTLIATAFYVVHAKDVFDLSAGISSLLAIALIQMPGLSGAIWGPMADRWGPKPVLHIGVVAGALANVLLLATPTLPLYVAGLFAIGCANTIVMIVDSKWLMVLDENRRSTVISFFSLAIAPAVVLFPLAGGYIAGPMGIRALFGLSAIAWLLGGLILAAMPGEATSTLPGTRSRSHLPEPRRKPDSANR